MTVCSWGPAPMMCTVVMGPLHSATQRVDARLLGGAVQCRNKRGRGLHQVTHANACQEARGCL